MLLVRGRNQAPGYVLDRAQHYHDSGIGTRPPDHNVLCDTLNHAGLDLVGPRPGRFLTSRCGPQGMQLVILFRGTTSAWSEREETAGSATRHENLLTRV
jgi:hypothetical protein